MISSISIVSRSNVQKGAVLLKSRRDVKISILQVFYYSTRSVPFPFPNFQFYYFPVSAFRHPVPFSGQVFCYYILITGRNEKRDLYLMRFRRCFMIGDMSMPDDFRHRDLFCAGPPVHERHDEFWLRHPPMNPGRRAKLFAPFDALRGFSEALELVRQT